MLEYSAAPPLPKVNHCISIILFSQYIMLVITGHRNLIPGTYRLLGIILVWLYISWFFFWKRQSLHLAQFISDFYFYITELFLLCHLIIFIVGKSSFGFYCNICHMCVLFHILYIICIQGGGGVYLILLYIISIIERVNLRQLLLISLILSTLSMLWNTCFITLTWVCFHINM